MAQTRCISANGIKNTGSATIAAAGNIPTSDTKLQDFSLSELNTVNKSVYGSHVYQAVSAVSSGNLGTIAPVTGSPFAHFSKTQFIMQVAGRYLNNAATTFFQSPSNKMQQRAWNKVKTTKTVYLTALSWTGGNDGLPTYAMTKSANTLNYGDDHETTTIGEFTIRTGAPTPTSFDYTTPYST
jgi:hypothetical protein